MAMGLWLAVSHDPDWPGFLTIVARRRGAHPSLTLRVTIRRRQIWVGCGPKGLGLYLAAASGSLYYQDTYSSRFGVTKRHHDGA